MKHIKKLLPLLFVSTVNAGQFSFQFYNDFFAGADQHFTNGMAISWLDDTFTCDNNSTKESGVSLVLNLVDINPLRISDTKKHYNLGASLSQIIVTPMDTTLSTPQYDDIPYAGYLALSGYLFEWNEKSFNEFRIEIGVVGEEALAEQVQNGFHTLIGNEKSKGWDTQLGTQYTLNALFRHGEISWKSHKNGSLSMDWFNHYGLQVGNFITDVFAGTMFRIGDNYIENFNVHYPYLREEATLLQLAKKHRGFGWSFSTGINGDLLAYSYVLDEAKNKGYQTSKRTFNASIYMGIDLLYNVHKITYFYQSVSPYTYKQDNPDTFGGLMYSYQF